MSIKNCNGNSQSQKPYALRWSWESPGGQIHNEIDHTIFNHKFRLTEVSVVLEFYTGSDHRLLRAGFGFRVKGKSPRK
ncbi:unnamed protein product [Heligmosomoides polygyrus]|uniref:Endo/exonuclease/phosphatase domain-containing protein n=1 Tax=Heligmosomoides polygyrus TaxID=6339 RepID=A0A183G1G0_HELPZ|nr:unnamed protein product [Heligmosomoides polygyrus]